MEPSFLCKVGPLSCFCVHDPGHVVDDDGYFWLAYDNSTPKEEDYAGEQPRVVRQPSSAALDLGRRLSAGERVSEGGSFSRRTTKENTDRARSFGQVEGVFDERDEFGYESEDTDIVIGDIEEVRAFQAAIADGQYMAAHKELLRLDAAKIMDPGCVLGAAAVEKVRRIATKYEYSLRKLEKQVRELPTNETNKDLGIEWGLELRKDLMTVVYTVEEPDLDIVCAFAALQERDLHPAFNKGLVRVEPLGVESEHDNFWRALNVSKTTNTKGDNVTITSGLDILDEGPLNALWVGQYTPEGRTAEVQGVQIPAPQDGHNRAEYSFQVCTLAPLRPAGHPDRTVGFHMKLVVEAKLPSIISMALNMMPAMWLRRLARSKLEQMPRDFRHFVKESQELSRRMTSSPRAEFYKRIRQRLSAKQKA